MALFERFRDAMKNKDADAMSALMSEDFEFVRHQKGETLDRAATVEMLRGLFASGAANVQEMRKIYENDDVLVTQEVMDFPDGTRESVLSVQLLQDGKSVHLETGATPVQR